MHPVFANDPVQTLTGLSRLQEFGLVGLLILAMLTFFGWLLRHVLTQAAEDREVWSRQSDKFIESQERISQNMLAVTLTLKEVSLELKSLREKVDKLESKHEANHYPDRPAPRRLDRDRG
jgi:hypothetical protein